MHHIRTGCVLAIIGVVGGLAALEAASTPASADAPTGQPVTATAVLQSDLPIEIDAVGHVQALRSVTARAQVAGQILSLGFHEGQSVKAGQVLAQIDPRLFQATVDEDSANLSKDRAVLENATIDLHRYGPLSAKGLVSTQELQTQQARVTQLRAQLSADQAIFDRDKVQLGFTSITSPIEGVAGLNLIDAGNLVVPGDTSGIVVVTQVEPIALLFPIPQSELPQVQLDLQSAGEAGLTVEAWSQGDTRKLDTGTLTAINNQVDVTSGTVMLKATFQNKKRLLWPGEFVNAKLVLHLQRGALSIPIAALQAAPSGPFVWAVASNGTAKQVAVSVTQTSGGRVLIGSGLTAGQQVVTNGQYGLVPGREVTVRQASTTGDNAVALRSNDDGRLGIVP